MHILPNPYAPRDHAPIAVRGETRQPEMHILPYPYTTVKREPLKIVNPDSNPGGEVHILPYPYNSGGAVKRESRRSSNGEMHILPYPSPAIKREPLKIVNPNSNPNGEVHILPYPYNPGGDVSIAIKREPDHPSTGEMHILPYPYNTVKREPMKIVTHDSNAGVRPAFPPGEEVHILPYPSPQ